MILLGIETATAICALAILQDGKLAGEYRLNIKNIHAKWIAQGIQSLLSDVNLTVPHLDGIAVSIGPGSFTGLRIGLSVAKGLAFERQIKVAAVPTLQALAAQAPIQNGLVCPVIKARSSDYFYSLFERKNFVDHEKAAIAVENIDTIIASLPAQTALIGELSDLTLSQKVLKKINLVPVNWAHLSAFTVARLGFHMIRNGQTAEIDILEPLYYQDFIAGKPKEKAPGKNTNFLKKPNRI